MKTPESGMPEEAMWREFFDAEAILRSLKPAPSCRHVVEFGCGYGTFTIPAARTVRGTVHALDIEPGMTRIHNVIDVRGHSGTNLRTGERMIRRSDQSMNIPTDR